MPACAVVGVPSARGVSYGGGEGAIIALTVGRIRKATMKGVGGFGER